MLVLDNILDKALYFALYLDGGHYRVGHARLS